MTRHARPIRVAHIITTLGSGGAERMLTRIATADVAGCEQIVVSLMDEGVYGAALRARGVPVHALGLQRSAVDPRAVFRLAALLRRLDPDVTMTWLYHADLAGSLASLLAGQGLSRVVWNVRCAQTEFAHYSWKTKAVMHALARLSRLPAAVAHNSQAGRTAHEAYGYRPRRWVSLPNGVDTEVWRPDAGDRAAVRAALGIAPGEVAVGLVARLDPQKGHELFLKANAVVAGRGLPIRPVLIGRDTERIAPPPELGDRVVALGERTDVERLMRGLDLVVLASSSEAFPNVIAEAMATAIPCVSTDVGEARAIIGDAGFVVTDATSAALAEAIERMIRLGDAGRAEIGSRARERIRASYAIGRSIELYTALWRRVAEAAGQAAE
ncbi:glycosyltransferase [Salinarimonas sp.]|uniref:glycosyltransferase n=1 Tax=Salinarimonas sp. TaxID=2766526 RepID=UPI0032D91858